MIFNIQTENFHPNARLFAWGHITDVPAMAIYLKVVFWETRCTVLNIAALIDLKI